MKIELLKSKEVDRLLRYPFGKTARLVKAGKFPHVTLPDGSIRILRSDIEELLRYKHSEHPKIIA